MIREMAWNTFKNTGDINTFLELKQVIDVEENLKAANYEIIKSEGINNCRKDSSRF